MIEHTIAHLVSHYGYIGLFIAIVLGIIGLPIPDEIMMTIVGYLSLKGHLHYSYTIFIAFLGSAIGMSLSFYIGYRFGLPFIERYGRYIHITPDKLDKVRDFFNKRGKLAVTIGYFIPGVRYFTAYLAGISKWPYLIFITYALPGALLWVWTFISLGYFFGLKWLIIIRLLHRFMLMIVFFVIIIVIVWRAMKGEKSKEKP